MTNKIEPWMTRCAEHIDDAYAVAILQQSAGTEPAIVEVAYIIAAHAPKETGIKPDNATPIKLKDGFECTLIDVVVKDYNRRIRNKGKKP